MHHQDLTSFFKAHNSTLSTVLTILFFMSTDLHPTYALQAKYSTMTKSQSILFLTSKRLTWCFPLPSPLSIAHGIRADGDAKEADVGAAGVGSGGNCTGAAGPAGPSQPTGIKCMLLLLVLLL